MKPWVTEDESALICPQCIAGRFEKSLENDYSWPARFGSKRIYVTDFTEILDTELVAKVLANDVQYICQVHTGVASGAVEDQRRGFDYQLCPKCSKVIALEDGCNHIVCLCMQNFCFICGKEAMEESNHWTPGGCPKYGQPGTDGEQFESEILDPDDRTAWLEENHAGNDLDTFEALVDRSSIFIIGPYAWSVAMQTSKDDPSLRTTMQKILQADEWILSSEDYDRLEKALQAWSPIHRLQSYWWSTVLNRNINQLRGFLREGPPPTNGASHVMIRHGLLSQPVTDVFNMATKNSRVMAFCWMYESVLDWSEEWIGHERSYAVFELGPSSDWGPEQDSEMDNRKDVAELMQVLMHEGDALSDGRFTFTKMRNTAILVTINAPQPNGNANWRHEAYWRMELLLHFWRQIVFLEDREDRGGDGDEDEKGEEEDGEDDARDGGDDDEEDDDEEDDDEEDDEEDDNEDEEEVDEEHEEENGEDEEDEEDGALWEEEMWAGWSSMLTDTRLAWIQQVGTEAPALPDGFSRVV